MTSPATTWNQFAMKLQGMLLHQLPIPPASAVPSWDLQRMNQDQLLDCLEAAEAPESAAIDAAIEAWPDSPFPWSRLSGPGLYFLRLRVDASLQFALQFCVAGDHPESSFIDFPAHYERTEMARFLFTKWWHIHGRMSAAMSMLVAYHEAQIGD
jgi:hypothetical protein